MFKSHVRIPMNFARPLMAVTATVALPAMVAAVEVKPVSLDDCLRSALEKNLDIRIAQYSPMVSRLTLSSAYWVYEPNMTAGAQQSFRATEGFAGIGQFNPDPNESWNERFDTGISGQIPTGLNYNLSGFVSRQSGTQSRFNPATGLFEREDTGFIYTPAVAMTASQPLMRNAWIDQPRLNIQLQKRNLKQGEFDLRNQVIQTATQVTLAYHDLIAARENVGVQRKALELAERSLMENKKRVEVGAMAPLDEKEAAAQVARSRADLISAERDLAIAQNSLKGLIADDFAGLDQSLFEPTAQLVAIPETFSKVDSWHKGLTMRPDVMRTKLEMEKQNYQLRFARNQLFPQLDLQGSFGLTGQDTSLSPSLGDLQERRNPNFSAGIRLTVPFTNRRARNEHQAAKLRKEETILRYKQLEQSVMVEIDNAIRTADAALQRVQATEAFREYSEAALQAEEKKLENGKSTSFLVLQRQRDFTSAQSEAIRAKSDYNKALARLAQAEGFTLERYSLQLELR
jgi:outer membrane protein TolC